MNFMAVCVMNDHFNDCDKIYERSLVVIIRFLADVSSHDIRVRLHSVLQTSQSRPFSFFIPTPSCIVSASSR